MSTKILGNLGESYAERFLMRNGYKVIDKNFRCKVGEVDIIALKDNILIFVEVKTRNSTKFGFPEEAVTPHKIGKIKRSGDWYVSLHPNLPKKVRIDVVSLLLAEGKIIREKIIQVT
jgi:putative endonuclease